MFVLNAVFLNLRQLCLILLFRLCFFGALSFRELLLRKKEGSGVYFRHFRLWKDSLLWFIARSKTDTFGKGVWLRVGGLAGSPLCPVQFAR